MKLLGAKILLIIAAVVILTCICLALSAQGIDTTAPFKGPITITKGGTYTGNYRSDNPTIPAITISTGDSVVLKDIYILCQGEGIHANGGANVRADNIRIDALAPVGLLQRKWAFYAYQPTYINLQHFYFNHTGGSRIEQTRSSLNNVIVKYGIIRNTDRRNGYSKVSGTSIAPALQFSNLMNNVTKEIAWNYFENEPGNSYVEDNINIYNTTNVDIHDNCINGAYPYPADSVKYSGSGITTDGDKPCAFIHAHRNTFVRTMNAAMNIPNGNNILYDYNTIINCGYIMVDGQRKYLPMSWSATAGWRKMPDPTYFNNAIRDNYIGYYRKGVNYPYPNRQDENQQPINILPRGLNQYFPDSEITIADEDAAINAFWLRAKAAGVQIGVTYKGGVKTPTPVIHDTIYIYKRDTLYYVPNSYKLTNIKP